MKPTVTLTHDMAYAYDMLAIAYIKTMRNSTNQTAFDAFARLECAIQDQQGDNSHWEIINSDEYCRLYQVNLEMYIRIDEMKTRDATGEDARYIDDRVYQRFLAKKALQERFFPSSPLTETKHGYTEQEDKRV